MPGIKHKVRSAPGDGASIVSAVELAEVDVEIPSPDPYISERTESMFTPRGPVEQTTRYWTKRGLSKWLSLCPKVPVYVPLDRENGEVDVAKARPLPVYYDGYRIDVPKGRNVMVAKPIAEIVENMQNEYRSAQSKGIDLYRIDPDDPNDRGLEIPSGMGVAG